MTTLNLKKDKKIFYDPEQTWAKAMRYGWMQSTLRHLSLGSEIGPEVAALEVHTNLFDYTKIHVPGPCTLKTPNGRAQTHL